MTDGLASWIPKACPQMIPANTLRSIWHYIKRWLFFFSLLAWILLQSTTTELLVRRCSWQSQQQLITGGAADVTRRPDRPTVRRWVGKHHQGDSHTTCSCASSHKSAGSERWGLVDEMIILWEIDMEMLSHRYYVEKPTLSTLDFGIWFILLSAVTAAHLLSTLLK